MIASRSCAGVIYTHFDKAPTREATRRAQASKKAAARERRLGKARGRIKELLDKNGGEPVEFSTVQRLTAFSPNTEIGTDPSRTDPSPLGRP